MKTKLIATALLVAILLGGCSGEKISNENEVRPGVYMSNTPVDFPFPTSGYSVYFVGETHGNRETKLVFQTFLKNLYQQAGVRDVILEEDQAYEAEANAYVFGLADPLPHGLCLRTDILTQVREFNATLPADEKVTVHLVDVDSPFPIIYQHLKALKEQIGPAAEAIQLPHLSDVRNWSAEQKESLVNELKEASKGKPEIVNALDTIAMSFAWHALGNSMDTKQPAGPGGRAAFAPIREDVITKNIEYVLSHLNGKPVLVFFGVDHGMKTMGDPNPPVEGFKPWVQRLVESGIGVYSLSIDGLSGTGYWRGESFTYEEPGGQQYSETTQYEFEDGTPIVSLFEAHPDRGIIYVDLRAEANSTVKLPPMFVKLPASKLYDGLVFFKEFTPMENACGD